MLVSYVLMIYAVNLTIHSRQHRQRGHLLSSILLPLIKCTLTCNLFSSKRIKLTKSNSSSTISSTYNNNSSKNIQNTKPVLFIRKIVTKESTRRNSDENWSSYNRDRRVEVATYLPIEKQSKSEVTQTVIITEFYIIYRGYGMINGHEFYILVALTEIFLDIYLEYIFYAEMLLIFIDFQTWQLLNIDLP
ncbi:hypothetical protein GQR58_021404 [Nymphon striatum]|nr:hypothetical protein GQR58_021404 [Nymphon striatum]